MHQRHRDVGHDGHLQHPDIDLADGAQGGGHVAEKDTGNLGDITTLADPSVVEKLIANRGQ